MSELHSQQWSLTQKVDKKAADVDSTVDQQTQQRYTVYSLQKWCFQVDTECSLRPQYSSKQCKKIGVIQCRFWQQYYEASQ